ncbi:MAG: DUF2752 domain-containing protein [Kiritimatiellae bacterium]|nr:DUF2752 domain-containing protein [Kiritimatiellia bacterium]
MRFERRIPRWDDSYSLVGLYFTPLLALSVALVARLPARWLPCCAWKRLTGIPCPTCGAGRAASALAHGAIVDAGRLQPLLTAAALLLTIVCLYAAVTAAFRWRRLYPVLSPRERRAAWLYLATLIVLNWVYLALDGR